MGTKKYEISKYTYNPLTHEGTRNSDAIRERQLKIEDNIKSGNYKRTKGITHFEVRTHAFANNINDSHKDAMENNPAVFRRGAGLFSS